MPPATLAPMARKPRNAGKTPDSPGPGTTPVRIAADLARMLSIIATALGKDVSEILSPHIRPFVEAQYAEVVKQLGREIKGGKVGGEG
jgi:hypothetical protein